MRLYVHAVPINMSWSVELRFVVASFAEHKDHLKNANYLVLEKALCRVSPGSCDARISDI